MINNRLINTFLDLVKISSPSKNEIDIKNYIYNALKDYPLEIIEDTTGTNINGNCGNLLIKLKANNHSHKKIAFDSHMDTVTPCDDVKTVVDGSIIKSDGTTILGGDDKIGVAIQLELIREIIENQIEHCELLFIFSVSEEEGLQGAKNLAINYYKDYDAIFVLDGEGIPGTFYHSAPYNCKGKIRVVGKAAHSGVNPEDGVNALYIASKVISQLPIGRINDFSTCNIGFVQGGVARNVVMPSVEMDFESRSLDLHFLQHFIGEVKKTFQDVCFQNGAVFEDDLSYGTPGYLIDDKSDVMVKLKKATDDAALSFELMSCGGGSNANVYNSNNVVAVLVGVGMENIHSTKEYVDSNNIIKSYRLVREIVQEYSA